MSLLLKRRRIDGALAAKLLPTKTLNQIWRMLAKKRRSDVLHGFGLYDRPLLASYSRSGTNWCRYIIEYISGCPTPGQTRLIQGDNYYVDRAHRAYPIMKAYKKVVLVLRDYRECILRHHRDFWPACPNVHTLLTTKKIKQPASWYVRNIQAFDAFQGEKLLLYYENLLERPDETITKLCTFLGLDPDKTRQFLKHHHIHYRKSVDAYASGGHRSETSSKRDLRFHARTKLTPDQVSDFDRFYFSRYPDLANRYLSCYHTRNRQILIKD